MFTRKRGENRLLYNVQKKKTDILKYICFMVAGAGLEPTTFGL